VTFTGNVSADAIDIDAGTFSGGIVNAELLNISAASGGITLSGDNAIESLGVITAPGDININSNRALSLSDSVSSTGGNDVQLTATGDLTVSATGQVIGDVVSLSATDNFINNRGTDAINASDHWVVYSDAPAGNVFGDLNSGNTAIWNGSINNIDPSSLTGNRYVFAFQPTLTITTLDDSKEYGDDLTPTLSTLFVASGFQPGVTNAYLADTANSVFSGAPEISSLGAAANADVSGAPYAVTATSNGLTLLNGYQVTFANNGTITISPLAITGTATADDRVYDGTTFNVGGEGLVSGDQLSGTLSRLVGEAPGMYNILLGSLTAGSNYTIEFNEGILTIFPETNISSLDNSLRTVVLPSALVNSSNSEIRVSFDENYLCDPKISNCESAN